MSALSATLRIARREAARAKVRSALVIAMIALPLVGVGAADVLWRTFQLSADQKASRVMGAADALVEDSAGTSGAQQAPQGAPRPGHVPSLASLLPAGSRLQVLQNSSARIEVRDLSVQAGVTALDYTTPLARGVLVQHSGTRPGSGEVALTTTLARRLGVALHDRLVVAAHPYQVVGILDSMASRTQELAVFAQLPAGLQDVHTAVLVKASRPLTWADAQRVDAAGDLLQPRHRLPGTPPEPPQPRVSASTLTAVTLVVGMVILEIVLLAGPAFAVGAKRQSRDLALVSASGGERRDVRRTVLSSGLVLGALGGVVGVVAGVVLAWAAVPALSNRTGEVPGPFEVRPLEIAGLVVVGVVTAVLAAVIPARNAAHQDVVAALTGRRGQLRSLRRTPVLGAIAAVAGALLALQGARQRDVNVILAGSMVAELGLVATTPFLVGLVGRLSPHLPLGPRLALRDAARNRARTAPAVSAVLAAVAGSIAVGTYMASMESYNRQAYEANGVQGSVSVALYGDDQVRKAPAVRQLVERYLPGAQIREVRGVGGEAQALEAVTVKTLACSIQPGMVPTRAQLLAAAREPQCNGRGEAHAFPTSWLVGDANLLPLLTGQRTAEQAAVLTQGGAIVPATVIDAGRVTFRVIDNTIGPSGAPRSTLIRTVTVPAVALPKAALHVWLLSPRAAALTGLPAQPVGFVALGDDVPTTRTEDQLRTALNNIGIVGLQVERGYVSKYKLGLLALLIGSAVIVLGASGIATGLAAADGRADLATLAAIGASPRTRRSLAAFQSAVTAGLGTVLGVGAGLVPALGMVRALNAAALADPFPRLNPYPLVLPWTNLTVTLLVVPLLAAGAAALLTRSRLPLVRRIA